MYDAEKLSLLADTPILTGANSPSVLYAPLPNPSENAP